MALTFLPFLAIFTPSLHHFFPLSCSTFCPCSSVWLTVFQCFERDEEMCLWREGDHLPPTQLPPTPSLATVEEEGQGLGATSRGSKSWHCKHKPKQQPNGLCAAGVGDDRHRHAQNWALCWLAVMGFLCVQRNVRGRWAAAGVPSCTWSPKNLASSFIHLSSQVCWLLKLSPAPCISAV